MKDDRFEQLPPHYLTPKTDESKPASEPEEDGFIAVLVIRKPTEAETNQTWEYNPIFPLGRIVATPAALKALGPNMVDVLISHADMDQGELGNEDQQANVLAVKDGERILSCFKVDGERFYVITEHDRS